MSAFPERDSIFSEMLHSDSHTVDFIKIPDRDHVELVVHGEVVFTCKIQDLQYGKSARSILVHSFI